MTTTHLPKNEDTAPERAMGSEAWLTLSPDVRVPLKLVTDKLAIMGVSGSGKTYTGGVIAEEMLRRGAPVVIADPLGVWHGLRAPVDDSDPLNIYILGGEHADLPLSPESGVAVADLVASKRMSVILDLSEFASEEQSAFLADFAEQLYRIWKGGAIHVIVDEADIFAPETPGNTDEYRSRRAIDNIARRGRVKGIGLSVISQRPAVVAKNVLSQVGTLVIHRITGPQDQKAVDTWLKAHSSDEQRRAMLKELAKLSVGEAFYWSPEYDLFVRTKIRKRFTFDSSATPVVGVDFTAADVRPLTPEALEDLRALLTQEIQEAEAKDPARLQARVAQLTKELAERPVTERIKEVPVTVEVERVVEKETIVEVPVVTPEDREHFEKLYTVLLETAQEERASADSLISSAKDLLNLAGEIGKKLGKTSPLATGDSSEGNGGENAPVDQSAETDAKTSPVAVPSLLPESVRFLDTLAGYPGARMTASQISRVTGITLGDSVWTMVVKELLDARFVLRTPTGPDKTNHYTIDDPGFEALEALRRKPVPRLPRSRWTILEYWKPYITENPTKVVRMVDFLLDQRPKSFTKNYLASKFQVKIGGTQIDKFLRSAVSLDLVVAEGTNQFKGTHDIP